MNHNIGSESQRLLKCRRTKAVINDEYCIVFLGKTGERLNIEYLG